LVLRDAETGVEYARFAIGRSAEFSVTFIHSVSNSPFSDYFEISDEEIYLVGSRYYEFIDGAPSELGRDEFVEYFEDGSMKLSGTRVFIPQLIYLLDKGSDHILGLNGQKYGLKQLCGGVKAVEFVFE
jgi:hypothetical protein